MGGVCSSTRLTTCTGPDNERDKAGGARDLLQVWSHSAEDLVVILAGTATDGQVLRQQTPRFRFERSPPHRFPRTMPTRTVAHRRIGARDRTTKFSTDARRVRPATSRCERPSGFLQTSANPNAYGSSCGCDRQTGSSPRSRRVLSGDDIHRRWRVGNVLASRVYLQRVSPGKRGAIDESGLLRLQSYGKKEPRNYASLNWEAYTRLA